MSVFGTAQCPLLTQSGHFVAGILTRHWTAWASSLEHQIQMTRRSFDLGQRTFLQGSLDQNRPDRLDRYDHMFQWNPASLALYEPADIRPGHIVADFG
jgi:hypothetical protein